VYENVAKVAGLSSDLIKIQYKPGKSEQLKPMPNKPVGLFYPDDRTFYYTKSTDYKEVSFACSPNGFWKLDLLKLCHPSCHDI
jgi:hypothetical protein